MNRLLRLELVVVLVVLFLSGLAVPNGSRAAEERTMTATARCVEATTDDESTVEVTIVNRTGASVRVGYVHGFTTPQVFSVLQNVVDLGRGNDVTIKDGETRILSAPWDDLRDGAGYFGAALVVTSAGVLVPGCSDRPADADTLTLGPAPGSSSALKREQVEIAARMIGQLESWRAYPALYSLLHPDAQEEVPFAAVACWYAGEYGLPGTPDNHIVRSTEPTDVTFGPWTYGVTGETYDAAEVTYRQKIGSMVSSDTVETVAHLVKEGGLWRWFFGANADAVAALPTDCDLGTADEAAATGSVEVDFFDCQPGMTPETFDAAACSPIPPGFDAFVLTPGPDVNVDALPGGPIFGISNAAPLGGGRFLFADLPFGTYYIGPGTNYQGPIFVAPGFGSPVGTSGPGASTYRVALDTSAPSAVITFYRLSRGIG